MRGMANDVEPDADPSWRGRVRAALAGWYDRGHRDLPWRRDLDPYRVLVSETMLVQTTVAAVVPFYERFLTRFPTVHDLAEADEAAVLKAWEGLGYYRRARQLHAAAQAIVAEHGGRVPEALDALRALPGVGRYIAGAVRSFAFDQPAPIVEANTQRVLTRLLAWRGDIAKSSTQNRLWLAAERLVPHDRPGRFNQAITELGAMVCTPRDPLCLSCPVAAECLARAEGLQSAIPAKTPKPPPLDVVEEAAAVVRDGGLLVLQRGSGRLWEGLWELPTIHVAGADPAARTLGEPVDLAEGVRRLTGVKIVATPESRIAKFGVTKHRVELRTTIAEDLGGAAIPYAGFSDVVFASPGELARLTMGSAMRKVANWAAGRLLGSPTAAKPGEVQGDFLNL